MDQSSSSNATQLNFPLLTIKLSITPKESLPSGSNKPYGPPGHIFLNRLRTGTGRCKVRMQRWGYNDDGQTMCNAHVLWGRADNGTPAGMPHISEHCTLEDLEGLNIRARSMCPALDRCCVATR